MFTAHSKNSAFNCILKPIVFDNDQYCCKQQTFDDSLEAKDRLVKQQALTHARMSRAGKLTSALSDEAVSYLVCCIL